MNKFYFVFIFLAFTNCKSGELSLDELNAFILNQENGLRHSAEVDGTVLTVTYRPTDILVRQELQGSSNKTMVDSLRNKYSPYYYFILSLSQNDKEALHQQNNLGQYSDLVQTMSFRMPQYVTLTTTQQDTIQVGDFILNRTYRLNLSTDILFVFSKEKVKENSWVQFNLTEFGMGLGIQRFRFDVNRLEAAPSIKFL